MGKSATAFELNLSLGGAGIPAYQRLYVTLCAEILEGRLRPGARLPSTRDLARQYGWSRGTILRAFEQLQSEGYLEGSIGSGTYVRRVLPEDLLQVRRPPNARPSAASTRQPRLSDYGRRVTLFSGLQIRPSRAFRANLPALDLFPTVLWAQVAARRLRRVSTNLLLGCDPSGYEPLRRTVADYLNASRGLKCTPEQVVIVTGVQEALDLVARMVLNPGDQVCMENPGYPGAAKIFEAAGARISALSVDDAGMILRLRARPRLVYVTPGHQFPLGVTMSLTRRLELLEWADRCRAFVLEDDYDSEFRYSGRPVPALQGLDRTGLVLFAGSFSKVLFPSIRLGYLVLPPGLVDRFAAMKSVSTRYPPVLDQAVLCDFIAQGHFARHIRRMRQVYAERLAVLLEQAQKTLGGLLAISDIEAGLQTVGWLCDGTDGETAARAAATRDVEVVPLSRYTRGPLRTEGLQLGFAAVDSREIRRGVEDLAAILERLPRKPSAVIVRRQTSATISGQPHQKIVIPRG